MDMDNSFNFGIVGTEELVEGGGDSFLFADPKEVELKKEDAPETKKEEAKKPTPKPFELEGIGGSTLFSQEEGEEESEDELEESKPLDLSDPQPIETEDSEETEAEVEETPESQFKALSQDLVELGIFSEEEEGEEEITTPEQFKEKWEKEKKKGASQEISSFLSKFGKKHIDAFNAIYVNGVDPEQYFQKQSTIESFENANIEDDFVQEQLVQTYYRKLGYKEEKIASRIGKLRDIDDLKEEAENAKEYLANTEKQELLQIEAAKTQQLQIKAQQEQSYVQGIQQVLSDKVSKKEFDGLPVNNNIAGEVFDTLVTKKWVLPSGEQLSDFDKFLMDLKQPANYEVAVKLALLYKTGFDFSKVKQKAISKESNELFKSVRVKEKVSKRNTDPKAFTF